MATTTGNDDALRRQIEKGPEDDRRLHRGRRWTVAAGAAAPAEPCPAP